MSDVDIEIETETYVRKPLEVQAIQVTEENMFDVAKWCGGRIQISVEDEKTKFVGVSVLNPLSIRQTEAYVGDWVLKSDTGYKVYTTKAFKQGFDLVK
jgi:hypothetical protein